MISLSGGMVYVIWKHGNTYFLSLWLPTCYRWSPYRCSCALKELGPLRAEKIFGPKKQKLTGNCRILHNEKLHNWACSMHGREHTHIRSFIIKIWKKGTAWNMWAQIGWRGDNIKMDLKRNKVGADRVRLAQGESDQCWAVVKTVMNFSCSIKFWELDIDFTRRTVVRGVTYSFS
jgi:hypothetical protein